MRRVVQVERLEVREAVSADQDALRAFSCSTGEAFEDDVDAFIRERALDLALKPLSRYKLWLVIEDEVLISVFSWFFVIIEPGKRMANKAVAFAIARSHQGARTSEGLRLSDYLLQYALDVRPHDGPVIALIDIDNHRSQDLCMRNGIDSMTEKDGQILALGTFAN